MSSDDISINCSFRKYYSLYSATSFLNLSSCHKFALIYCVSSSRSVIIDEKSVFSPLRLYMMLSQCFSYNSESVINQLYFMILLLSYWRIRRMSSSFDFLGESSGNLLISLTTVESNLDISCSLQSRSLLLVNNSRTRSTAAMLYFKCLNKQCILMLTSILLIGLFQMKRVMNS